MNNSAWIFTFVVSALSLLLAVFVAVRVVFTLPERFEDYKKTAEAKDKTDALDRTEARRAIHDRINALEAEIKEDIRRLEERQIVDRQTVNDVRVINARLEVQIESLRNAIGKYFAMES